MEFSVGLFSCVQAGTVTRQERRTGSRHRDVGGQPIAGETLYKVLAALSEVHPYAVHVNQRVLRQRSFSQSFSILGTLGTLGTIR